MLCPKCKIPMVQKDGFWKCKRCGHTEPDPDNFDRLRLNEIKKTRDKVWDIQEELDKLGVPEASELMNKVADLLTEEIDSG